MSTNAEERLIDSLAERLYRAHNTWRADLAEGDGGLRPYWWALADEYKTPYRECARTLLDAEGREDPPSGAEEASAP